MRRRARSWLWLAAAVVTGAVLSAGLLGSRSMSESDHSPPPPELSASADSEGPAPTEPVDPTERADETDERLRFVAPTGSDGAAGTEEAPFRTIQHAIRQLEPGDTLVVRGGTYREQVELPYAEMTRGRTDAPIVVQAAAGERPIIEGRFRLSGADHWTIRGINVTWSDENEDDEHMVQFRGGTGWRFTEAEVWGARSFSAINVGHGAHDFRLDNLYVHHTHPSNDLNQDHLIYLASGNEGGVVEHNILAVSPNGRGIKVGPGALSEPGSDDVVIRYNTFYANTGPSNIRFSGDSSHNEVYGNIFVRPADGEAAVSSFELVGRNNVVRDNLFWEADAAVAEEDGLIDGGGNALVDPRFVDPEAGDFRTRNPAAEGFGAYARPGPAR